MFVHRKRFRKIAIKLFKMAKMKSDLFNRFKRLLEEEHVFVAIDSVFRVGLFCHGPSRRSLIHRLTTRRTVLLVPWLAPWRSLIL